MNSERETEIIQEIVPSVSRNVIEETLLASPNINEAINSLTTIRETESASLSSHHDIVIDYRENILKINQDCSLKVNRRNIWKDALTFYMVNIGNLVKLQQPLNVTFAGENDIDALALKAEFFTKIFEITRRELIELPDQMPRCEMPKGSGRNLQISKIFGVILAHSLLQEGQYFNYLAPWGVEVLLDEKGISGNAPLTHIPVTAATGNLINFVKSLNECDTEKSINNLFDTADGPV